MNFGEQDERFMQRALALAAETVRLASPNPCVGCMIVKDGAVVGEGAHRYDERDHAEIVALKMAGEAAQGATVYVTLEPCSHQGRTGPCADALVAARVGRVVVATLDPNPLVSGGGIARLRAAGIRVETGLLQQEARALNDGFAQFIRTKRPFVTLKAALSADGRLAPADSARVAGEPFWLTGAEARAEVQRMRHASDAILTGIGTVLADDPALTDRTELPRRRGLLRVVLDAELRLPLESQLVRSVADDVLVFGADGVEAECAAVLEAAGVMVAHVPMVGGRLDLRAVLAELGRREMLSVLLEAGSRLNGSFVREDRVDRMVFFHSRTELGSDALPFAEGVALAEIEQRLTLVSRRSFGSDVCVAGYLHDAWECADALG